MNVFVEYFNRPRKTCNANGDITIKILEELEEQFSKTSVHGSHDPRIKDIELRSAISNFQRKEKHKRKVEERYFLKQLNNTYDAFRRSFLKQSPNYFHTTLNGRFHP